MILDLRTRNTCRYTIPFRGRKDPINYLDDKICDQLKSVHVRDHEASHI